ncbi:MAG TPA: L-fucokinase [Opitutaceae bacterium]|nr:L-fucokinase [Opitutaceae bacterium]
MIDALLSLPAPLASYLSHRQVRASWERRLRHPLVRSYFFGSDPTNRKLGSGGGTVHLLHSAWRRDLPQARPGDLLGWVNERARLILHAGGESRRLPAYAALGKAFLPLPPLTQIVSPRHDLMLCDVQLPRYAEALAAAGPRARALVTSGDVWLEFEPGDLPEMTGDIVGLGMSVPPEVARHFGVFFIKKGHRKKGTAEHPISFFLQKPSPEEIRQHATTHDFYVDTGMWLLSAPAVLSLFQACGWSEKAGFSTPDQLPGYLDLYTEIGGALGAQARLSPRLKRAGFGRLQTSVIPLDPARFEHFGSSRQLFEALDHLQAGQFAASRHYFLSSASQEFSPSPAKPSWVDSSRASIARPLSLAGWNLVNGLPRGHRLAHLPEEHCVEAIPIGKGRYVLRPYHLDDSLRGTPATGATICGHPAADWLRARGFPTWKQTDVFQLPIYPVLTAREITQQEVDGFFASAHAVPTAWSNEPTRRRVKAADIAALIDHAAAFTARVSGQREKIRLHLLKSDRPNGSLFSTDFHALADLVRSSPVLRSLVRARGEHLVLHAPDAVAQARVRMLLSQLSTGKPSAHHTQAAFTCLRQAVVSAVGSGPVLPRHALKEDQIVWARSAVRLDLAGGWTDTPPHCFEYGGSVVNVAVTLNGQPPIQVFARRIRDPFIRLRSIDLGVEQTLDTREALATYADPRSGFSLPKAALALAGLLPEYHLGSAGASLRTHLQRLGGGLELSLLCAVPKGSGLGTSSILGATLLGALNQCFALGWDPIDVYVRVLAMEQLLTTGGGWQDQAGALFPGLKLIQTEPGFSQRPTVRYLDYSPLREAFSRGHFLLYYTGLTRYAKGILQEIVHRLLLGERTTLLTLREIQANALRLHQALQQADMPAITRAIRRSWLLNQRLDPGTNTPEVQAILDRCTPHGLIAAKLLGAGGGGYLLLCTHDERAALRIRQELETNPPNHRARFVEAAVAEKSFEVTMS